MQDSNPTHFLPDFSSSTSKDNVHLASLHQSHLSNDTISERDDVRYALLQKCKRTIEELQSELEAERNLRIAAEQDATEGRTEINSLRGQEKDSEHEIFKLKNQVTALESVNDELNQKIINADREERGKDRDLSEIRFKTAKQESSLLDLKRENEELQTIIEKKQTIIQGFNEKIEVISTRLDEVESENSDFLKENAQLKAKCKEYDDKKKVLEEQNEMNKLIKRRLEQTKEEFQRTLEDATREYERRDRQRIDEHNGMREQIELEYQAKEARFKEQMNNTIEEVKQSIDFSLNEKGDYEAKIADLVAEKTDLIRRLEGQALDNHSTMETIHELNSKVDKLSADKLRAETTLIAENDRLKKRNEEYRVEVDELKVKLEHEYDKNGLFQHDNETNRQDNSRMKMRLTDLETEIEVLRGDLSREKRNCEATVDSYKAKIHHLEEKHRSVEEHFRKKFKESQRVRNENESLLSEIKEVESNFTELIEKQKKEILNLTVQLKESREELLSRSGQLTTVTTESNTKISSLQQIIQDLETRLTDKKAQLDHIKSKYERKVQKYRQNAVDSKNWREMIDQEVQYIKKWHRVLEDQMFTPTSPSTLQVDSSDRQAPEMSYRQRSVQSSRVMRDRSLDSVRQVGWSSARDGSGYGVSGRGSQSAVKGDSLEAGVGSGSVELLQNLRGVVSKLERSLDAKSGAGVGVGEGINRVRRSVC
mmetsp:Transcript_49601/g.56898  ORF Transcript_49601/g.56898 Transcript_49601/m.56898 type:complete len:709 (-) Transcript_49601:163-2289(-)